MSKFPFFIFLIPSKSYEIIIFAASIQGNHHVSWFIPMKTHHVFIIFHHVSSCFIIFHHFPSLFIMFSSFFLVHSHEKPPCPSTSTYLPPSSARRPRHPRRSVGHVRHHALGQVEGAIAVRLGDVWEPGRLWDPKNG